jgi:hypothetical protein
MMEMDVRQKQAYRAMLDLIGLKEIPGPEDHPWITEGWKIVGADWYDDDETYWCGMATGRVTKEAGLPILAGGMSVQARAWHEKEWGEEVPLEKAPQGAIIVLQNHVAFLHELIRDASGKVTGYKLLGGNQSNRINIQTYKLKTSGRHKFLSARVWPASAQTVMEPAITGKPSTTTIGGVIAVLIAALIAWLGFGD